MWPKTSSGDAFIQQKGLSEMIVLCLFLFFSFPFSFFQEHCLWVVLRDKKRGMLFFS